MIVRMATASQEARIRWLHSLPSLIAEVTDRWSLTVGGPFPRDRRRQRVVSSRNGCERHGCRPENQLSAFRGRTRDSRASLLGRRADCAVARRRRPTPCTPSGAMLAWDVAPRRSGSGAGHGRCGFVAPDLAPPTCFVSVSVIEYHAVLLAGRGRGGDVGIGPIPDWFAKGSSCFVACRAPRLPSVLATRLHVGNVLRSFREPWLVIDPKPFLGDPAYDATQHLLNCADGSSLIPTEPSRIRGVAGSGYARRVGLWTFARAAVLSGAGHSNGLADDLVLALKASISF